MKKPKCPWNLPFKLKLFRGDWLILDDLNSVFGRVKKHFIPEYSKEKAELICYALNAVYKPKKAKKK
jgi:hypothetical protein